jgi:alanine-synthesizing transaminase
MFSFIVSRLDGETNPLYRLQEKLKSQGKEIRDLISGNVTEQGILFPQDLLEEILVRASQRCRIYQPDSLGARPAREAISRYYSGFSVQLNPDHILITPGTSISYWYCFKLLANEGEEILCPRPSYPLFDYIALLSGVNLIPYRLNESDNWSIDLANLENCISTKTRAVALISPHNPTGRVTNQREIAGLAELARRYDLAIISDEVFSEFLINAPTLPRPACSAAPLVFTLNGFSKMFALPGMKFGWMAVSGDAERVQKAMRALELMSDTFLPVNEIVQSAAPEILQEGKAFLEAYRASMRRRWEILQSELERSEALRFRPPDGGFYVTLKLKDLDEERAAEAILSENLALVHPGYFYDMDPHHLVLSFVLRPEILREMLPRLVGTLDQLRLPSDS